METPNGRFSREERSKTISVRTEYFLRKMDPRLNMRKLKNKIEDILEAHTLQKWSSKFEVGGLKKLGRDKQYMLFSNHQAHLDYVTHWYAWYSHWNKQGLIKPLLLIAGDNLDSRLLKFLGADLGAQGAFFIDRHSISSPDVPREDKIASNNALKTLVGKQFEKGRSMLVYIGGTREKRKHFPQGSKNWFFNFIARNPEKFENVELVPVAVVHSRRPEEVTIPFLKRISQNHDAPSRLAYYATDAIAYGRAYLEGWLGLYPVKNEIVTRFGDPISLSTALKGTERTRDNPSDSEKIKSVITREIRREYQQAVHTLNGIRQR